MSMDAEMLAKARFKRLNVVRFVGVLVAMVGAAIMAGKVDLPRLVGLLVLLGGIYYALIFPSRLVKRWKKQDGA
ncbi:MULTISPECIES: hypothetical protein [Novosphingobium]|uniref:Uncharacterized protein n=1 Tax=Novosphingobium sediminicola TaxID=563162 RepID=A0A7W6G4Q3_9SPHN|nr:MULTISPECIES: hypothetical protein [Novosphingobium]MBB3953245.1 hypothetical protein [Novosphingobium sediminicola]NOW46516.1 hypothetical protein [Novosphingobium sp. SG751A]